MISSFAGAFNTLLNRVMSPEEDHPGYCSSLVSYGLPAIGFIAGVPFLHAACDVASDKEPGCTLFQIGTVVSYGFGAVWMISSVISRMRPEPEEAHRVNNCKTRYLVSQHAVANALSVINTVIPAYISYHFNDSNPYYLFISVPISYAFNAFAFYGLTDLAYCRRMILNFTHGSASLSNQFSQDINRLITLMINAPRNEYQSLSSQLFQISEGILLSDDASKRSKVGDYLLNQQEVVHERTNYLDNLLGAIAALDERVPSATWRKLARLSFQAVFLVFPLTNIVVNKRLSRQAVALLFDSDIATVIFSSIMVMVSAVIDTVFAIKTAGQIYDAFARKINGGHSSDYLSVKKPTLAATFSFLSLILAALSSSSRVQIAKKTVGSSFISVCAGINATIFEWYAQRDLSGRFFESGVVLFKARDSQLIRDVRCLRAADDIVKKSDHHQLNGLLRLRA